MTTFVLATANPDKAREIDAIFVGTGITLVPRPPDVPEVEEDGATLEENALLKARALVAATGRAAIADDTGLFVDALEGAPGVHSARYAGPAATYDDNVAKLLAALGGVVPPRRARFRTVAAVAFPDGEWFCVDGVLEGEIATSAVGAGGFGYDPVFVPDNAAGRTLAELSSDEKNVDSHRARAFRALAVALGTG